MFKQLSVLVVIVNIFVSSVAPVILRDDHQKSLLDHFKSHKLGSKQYTEVNTDRAKVRLHVNKEEQKAKALHQSESGGEHSARFLELLPQAKNALSHYQAMEQGRMERQLLQAESNFVAQQSAGVNQDIKTTSAFFNLTNQLLSILSNLPFLSSISDKLNATMLSNGTNQFLVLFGQLDDKKKQPNTTSQEPQITSTTIVPEDNLYVPQDQNPDGKSSVINSLGTPTPLPTNTNLPTSVTNTQGLSEPVSNITGIPNLLGSGMPPGGVLQNPVLSSLPGSVPEINPIPIL